MDKDTKKKTLLGALILGGLLLFTLSIFLIGSRQNMFSHTITISSTFKDVNGLRKGDYVSYAGVKVGVVSKMKIINDTTVLINLDLQPEMAKVIRKSALVYISSDGLMGNKLVKIKARSSGKHSQYISENDTLGAVNPFDMDAITKKVLAIGNDAETITENFSLMSEKVKNGSGILGTLLADTSASDNLKNILSEFSATSDKSVTISQHLLDITNSLEHGESTASVLLNDTTMGSELKQIIDYLTVSSRYMEKITTDVSDIMNSSANKKGTGQDSVFVNDIRNSITNIKQGTQKFNENMEALQHNILLRRYFKKHKKG